VFTVAICSVAKRGDNVICPFRGALRLIVAAKKLHIDNRADHVDVDIVIA
jgi:hypothetical protein